MGAEGADALLEGAVTVNDALRELFFETGTAVEFLKAGNTEEFLFIDSRESGWWLEYSNFRRNFLLEIAEAEDISDGIDLAVTMAEATHIRIGDDVYVINDGDTIPPKGTDVSWKIYCDKFTKRGNYSVLTG
jgi:hypothetical protein